MNKRRILAIAMSLVIVAIIAVGATMAYLTYTDSAKNTFTVGDVKIKLLESSLHRENAGVANATGAVVGNVNAEARVEVRPNHTPGGIDGYFVCAPSETRHIWARHDAVAAARELAESLARAEAKKRGISGEMTIKIEVEDSTGHASRGMVDLGSTVVATAIGGAVL